MNKHLLSSVELTDTFGLVDVELEALIAYEHKSALVRAWRVLAAFVEAARRLGIFFALVDIFQTALVV